MIYRHASIVPLIGGETIAQENVFGTRPEAIKVAPVIKKFQNTNFIVRQSGVVTGHAYHLYVIQVQRRDELINYLRKKNIFTQVHYIPAHLMPYYKQFGWKKVDMPHSESYYSSCLSLPMYPTLKFDEQNFVIDEVIKFISIE